VIQRTDSPVRFRSRRFFRSVAQYDKLCPVVRERLIETCAADHRRKFCAARLAAWPVLLSGEANIFPVARTLGEANAWSIAGYVPSGVESMLFWQGGA